MKEKSSIILAIDPGTVVMGYAILEEKQKKPALITMGVLKLAGTKDIYARLEKIYSVVSDLIKKYEPTSFAIEAPFFGKNVQSMLKLGRAQGVAIAASMQAGIGVSEYSPKKVKLSVTGNGNAAKEQVWKMLQHQLNIEERPQYLDASDALAVALCHYYELNGPLAKQGKGFKSWDDFIQKNSHRISS